MKLNNLMIRAGVPMAFENEGAGGWKMDGDKPVFKDGNPVWVNTDGTEAVLQRDTISRLNAEARSHRTKAEEWETKYKPYEGLDPVKARDALDKLSKIDAKTLIDAGEVDRVKDQIKGEFAGQITEKEKEIGTLRERVNGMITDNAFNGSEYIRSNVEIPVEMLRATFANRFKVENDTLVAYDTAGNRMLSKKNIGEPAGFDEAIEMIVENYPHKDRILKAPEHRGSGSDGGGGSRGGGLTMKRAAFNQLPPAQQVAFSAKVNKGEARLID